MFGNMTVIKKEPQDSKEKIQEKKNLFHFLPYQLKGYLCCVFSLNCVI